MLAEILPPGVVAADIWDEGQHVALRGGETDIVAAAGAKRQRDFAMGRHSAHLALKKLGIRVASIGSGARGEPLWPEGTVGSITHTKAYAAAITAPRRLYGGLGLDAEPVGAVNDALFARLFTAMERERLSIMETDMRAQTATILFCAKEAHYKAVRGASPLRFQDLEVTLGDGLISVQAADGTSSTGRHAVTWGLAIVVLAFRS